MSLQQCIEKARKHVSNGRVNVYSMAVDKRGNVLGEAGNTYVKTSPKQAFYAARVGLANKTFLHAEMLCLIRAAKSGKIVDKLYVARVGNNGEILAGKPCTICQTMIECEFEGIEIICT